MLWYCVKPFQYFISQISSICFIFQRIFYLYTIGNCWPYKRLHCQWFRYFILFIPSHLCIHFLTCCWLYVLMNWNQIGPNDTCNDFKHHRFSLAMLVQHTHSEFIFRKCIRIIYWLIITRHVFRVHWRKTNWRWCC